MTTDQSASQDAEFESIFASGRDRGGNPAPPEAEAPVPAPAAQEAVAPAAEAPKADLEEPSDTHNGRTVPLNEHLSERKKYKSKFEEADKRAQALEARLQSLQEQNERLIQGFSRQPQQAAQPQPQQQVQQAPDPWTDPEGYVAHRERLLESRFEQRRLNDRLHDSEDRARSQYGDDVVDAAFEASRALSKADIQRMMTSRHPYAELVKWHQSQETLRTIGGDLNGFRKKIEDEARAKVIEDLKAGRVSLAPAVAAQQAQPTHPQSFPSTLASVTQTGAQGGHLTEEAAMSAVYGSNRASRRRK